MMPEKWGIKHWVIWRFRKACAGWPENNLADLLGQAHREWRAAQALFNEVTEPALVDLAIHYLALTESRYAYLLKEARQKGYTAWQI